MARHASEDRTSVGLKCRRANVLLPEPDTPTSTTRESSGRVSFMFYSFQTPPSAWARRVRDLLARRARSGLYSRSDRQCGGPNPETQPWSTRTGGRGDGIHLLEGFPTSR